MSNHSEVCFGVIITWIWMSTQILKNIVYNDFNPLNYNLFMCVQNPTELLKSVESIPCQQRGVENTPTEYKDLFKEFQSEIFADDFEINYPDYDVAAKYAYILTQVFQW